MLRMISQFLMKKVSGSESHFLAPLNTMYALLFWATRSHILKLGGCIFMELVLREIEDWRTFG